MKKIVKFCLVAIVMFVACNSVEANNTYKDTNEILSVDCLVTMNSNELAKTDIALMNLICAEGLRGSENLDIEQSLKILDKWAQIVKDDTDKRIQAYYKNPEKYDNSVNKFKLVNMVLTLKEQTGVDYNQEIMKKTDFIDSRDFFIHGCLTGKKQGGCISIPVLCVCVGRRLGYSLKLALTREHTFFRWDDGKERFNIEACCPGCDSHPDEYYKGWPKKISDEDVKRNGYLRSLTAGEELGLFLETRGHCLYDEGKVADALVMYSYAYKLMPDSVSRLANIDMVLRKEAKKFADPNNRDKIKKSNKG